MKLQIKTNYLILIFFLIFHTSFSQSDDELKNSIKKIFKDIIASIGNDNVLEPKLVIPTRNQKKVAYLRGNTIYFELQTAKMLYSKFGKKSNDAIAYVLGHEIAHHYLEHAWMRKVGSTYFSEDMKEFLSKEKSSQRKEEEMEADLHAGFFSRLAGYNSLEIAKQTIEHIYETYAINPNISGYPSLEDRKNTIELKIDELKELNAVFEIANLSLITGDYMSSQGLFEHILYEKFTSREIYNNLGVSYFFDGLTYTDYDVKKFIFPVIAEQNSRTEINSVNDFNQFGSTRSLTDNNKIAIEKFKSALKYFERAYRLDKKFIKADFNSYCTKFIMNYIDSVSFKFEEEELDKIKFEEKKYIYELKGLYYALNKNKKKAKKFLTKAADMFSKTAMINLEHFKEKDGVDKPLEEKKSREIIDSLDFSEIVTFGLIDSDKYISASGNKIRIKELKNSTVYEINASNIIQITKNHTPITAKGLKIKDSIDKIIELYGDEFRVYNFFDKVYYSYEKDKIVFETINNKITRWLIYKSSS